MNNAVRVSGGASDIATGAWPFKGRVDRWQEIEFHVTHVRIWTGAMEAGSGHPGDPQRAGFHMRGFHGITPETGTTTHYFWSVATNPHPDRENVTQTVVEQSAATFDDDKIIIEAQYRNQLDFPNRPQLDIHVDAGPNRAPRHRAAGKKLSQSTSRSMTHNLPDFPHTS